MPKLEFEKSITRDWPLFIVEMLHAGFTAEFNKQFSFKYTEVFFDCYSDHLDVYRAPVEHIDGMRSFILEQLKQNPEFITTCSNKLRSFVGNFLAIVKKVNNADLSKESNVQLSDLLSQFIDAHRDLEPTFVINFWFPIQMESYGEESTWKKQITIAAKTRAETENVGPEGDKIAQKLANEICRRIFDTTKYSKVLLLEEAHDFLLKNRLPDESDLSKRLNGFVYAGKGIQFETLQNYIEQEGYVLKSVTSFNETKIKGVVASPGKVRGKVRVILSKNKISEVQTGEILVTTMTTPEFMPALKKAIAFVTDEGGVTCHAAIVSRELNKPCIIGTKNATQILKDGDMVEVDADKAVVKMIKRYKE